MNLGKMSQLDLKFNCQMELNLMTLKEFLELFISSISNDDQLHFEIFSSFHHYVGISLSQNSK